jgi:hypothetical protein
LVRRHLKASFIEASRALEDNSFKMKNEKYKTRL